MTTTYTASDKKLGGVTMNYDLTKFHVNRNSWEGLRTKL